MPVWGASARVAVAVNDRNRKHKALNKAADYPSLVCRLLDKRQFSRLSCFFLLAFSIHLVSQQPVQTRHVVPAVASGKIRPLSALPPSQRLNFSIVLPLRNQDALDELLAHIYDPSSPEYRHFLSVREFAELFAPAEQDYQAVAAFAAASGFQVGEQPANRLIVPLTGTVDQVQRAFHVGLKVYPHPYESRTFYSPDREPSVSISVPIVRITGLDNFSLPRSLAVRPSAAKSLALNSIEGSGPSNSYLGSDMRAAYYGGSDLTGAGQTVALVQFDGYFKNDVDLSFSSAGQAYSVPIVNVLLDGADGTPSATGDDAEQVLDIVQAIGMAPGLSQVRVYIGSIDVDILNAIATDNLARQISISWSWQVNDTTAEDQIFKELAAQGQSVFAASGDYGAFDPRFPYYFPAEDAWVTAVGGTVLQTKSSGGPWQSEIAWDRSGGGISPGLVALPAWQNGLATDSNGASATYRNVPDVSMESDFDNWACEMGQCTTGWAGTSFAAPRWAGLMALVNQQAAAAGDPSPGFLNPALYALGARATFHDIASGDNHYVEEQDTWFTAASGYDLVTGWGTPAGQAFIDALAPWPQASFQLSLSAASVSVDPGKSGTITVNVDARNGFSGSVNLSLTGVPAGVTASWSANPATSASVLTLQVGPDAPRGQYRITVTGTSGNLTSGSAFTLLVNASGFSISSMPESFEIRAGVAGSATFSATPYGGFNGHVSFALVTTLPAGLGATWTTDATGVAMLTLSASTTAQTGVVELTVTGTSGTLSASTVIQVYVRSPIFVINVLPVPASIAQGGSVTATVSVVPLGDYAGLITLTAPALPPGVKATFSPASIIPSQTAQLTLTASSTAPLGTVPSTFLGTGPGCGALFATDLTVVAAPTPGFALSASVPSLVISQGGAATATITVNPAGGFTAPVSFSVDAMPGETLSFSPNPTVSTSTLTIALSNAVRAGTYWLKVSGVSGDQSSYAVILLNVTPAADFAIAVTPDPIAVLQGSSASGAITVTPSGGFSGSVDFALSGLPDGVTATIAPGSFTSALQVSAAASVAPGDYAFNLSATSGEETAITAVRVSVAAPPSGPASTIPAIAALSPAYASAGAAGFNLTVGGAGFDSHSIVYWGTTGLSTTLLTGKQLVAQVPASLLSTAGIASIMVRPSTGAPASNALQFEIDSIPASAGPPVFSHPSATVAPGDTAIYAVAPPASVKLLSATCLNLPAGASCAYAPATGSVTISTTAGTPAGMYPVTVVFVATLTTTSSGFLFFPFLALPFTAATRKRRRTAFFIVAAAAMFLLLLGSISGCGGGTSSTPPSPSPSSPTPAQTTTSGVVTLTVT